LDRLSLELMLLYNPDMNASCCNDSQAPDPHRGNSSYRRVLWLVLAVNAVMFLVEIGAGLAAGSASLQADALDFLGDASNYAISLFVVGMALRYRAMAAMMKGATMGSFGVWVIGVTTWHALHGALPSAFTMGAVGIAALVANAASFGLLWAFRGRNGLDQSCNRPHSAAWLICHEVLIGPTALCSPPCDVCYAGAEPVVCPGERQTCRYGDVGRYGYGQAPRLPEL
jgi:hypothetical protein